MNYIGLDVHSLNFTMAHLNQQGRLCRIYERPTSAYNLIDVVGKVSGPKALVVEECHLAQWVKHTLEVYVDQLVVCDPKRNKWICGDDFANDKTSAIKLAKLLLGGFIKAIYHGDDEAATLRSLFLHYFDCNRQVTRFKNKVKSTFRQVAIRPAGGGIYDPQSRQVWLDQLQGFPHLVAQAEHWFNLLEHLQITKDEAYAQMVPRARRLPVYKHLLLMPGVGPVIATGYIAMLDTPHRFSRKNKLWRYAGLGNCYHESDGTAYKDRPSKSGNRALKWVVMQHYHAAMRCKESNRFQRKQQNLLRRGLDNKTVRRHICRSLLSSVRAMWMKEEAYHDRV